MVCLGVSFFNRGEHVSSNSKYFELPDNRADRDVIDDLTLVCQNLTGSYDEVRFDIRREGKLIHRTRVCRNSRALRVKG